MRSKKTARSGRINIQHRIALLVAETISESATDAQKPPSPQQTSQQQQQQPLQQQQQPPGGIAGGTGGGDGTPAATPTSAGNVQQSQQAVPSTTPTPTTANPHSTAGPPSSNQPSPHPSPLYPVIPQQASQPNGSTQGKPNLQVSVGRPMCWATEREFACLYWRLSRQCADLSATRIETGPAIEFRSSWFFIAAIVLSVIRDIKSINGGNIVI